MKTKSTTEKTEWPTVAEQEAFWRTKEADLSLDKVEATTDYIDHFLVGNPTPEIPFPSNETDLSGENRDTKQRGSARHRSNPGTAELSGNCGNTSARERISPAQNFHLSIEDRKAPSVSTLAEQKWAEPEWTLRDEVGESYREIP